MGIRDVKSTSHAEGMTNASSNLFQLICVDHADIVHSLTVRILATIKQLQTMKRNAHYHVRLNPHPRRVVWEGQWRVEVEHAIVRTSRIRWGRTQGDDGAQLVPSRKLWRHHNCWTALPHLRRPEAFVQIDAEYGTNLRVIEDAHTPLIAMTLAIRKDAIA